MGFFSLASEATCLPKWALSCDDGLCPLAALGLHVIEVQEAEAAHEEDECAGSMCVRVRVCVRAHSSCLPLVRRGGGRRLGHSPPATSLTCSLAVSERGAHPANPEGNLEDSGRDGGAEEE